MKKLIKKAALLVGLDAFFVRRSNAAIILTLHQVEEHDGSMIAQRLAPTSPNIFEGILRYLQKLGYSFVSLDEIINSPDCSKKVAITFDDGFRSVYVNAFPILRKYQAPFTIFLTTAMLGASHLLWQHRIYAVTDCLSHEDIRSIMERCSLNVQSDISLKKALGILVRQESPDRLLLFADELAARAQLSKSDEAHIAERLYLSPNEIKEMLLRGMSIGAHGHSHWCLETLDRSQTESEIIMCKEKIKEAFGVLAVHYALPFGRTNPHVRSMLEWTGFKSLCTTQLGLVRRDTDLYALPRLAVGSCEEVSDLAGQILYYICRKGL